MAGPQSDSPRSDAPGSDETRRTAADMEAEIRQLREDMAKLAADLSAAGEHTYGAARRIASDGMEQLRAQGEAAVDGLRANARDMEAQVIASVREKPVTALAVAAGVGFLFALVAWR